MEKAEELATAARSGRRAPSKAAARSTKKPKRSPAKGKKRPDAGKTKLASAKLSQAGQDLLALYSGQPLDPAERERQSLVTQAKAIVKSDIMQAREHPSRFIEYCFRDSETGAQLRQADVHEELQEAMLSGEDVVNELPRDHGKTTQLEGHLLWRLGTNPNLRIKIVCASDSKAVERLFAIIQHIRTNDRVHGVFPHLKPASLGDWTKHKIVVDRDFISRDASIEALGVLSTATGGRADLLAADDVVDRRNALELPKLRSTVKSAWDSDWSNLLEPNGQTIYNATPWHTADLTHKLEKNPAYRVMRRPVGGPGDHFAPLWEEKWNREQLERRRLKIGQLEYDRGFRLIALSGEFVTVQQEWIEYWEEPPDVDKLQIFSAFDVSSGKASDYFANVVLGLDVDSLRLYVLEAWHDKLTFLHRAKAVQQQTRRWRPSVTGIEEESMKSLTQYLDETTLLNIVAMRPHLAKSMRLMGVTPVLERGQVLFNPSLRPEAIANRDEHGDVVGELTEFPLGANDDLVDAFVYAVQLAQAFGGDDDDGIDLDFTVLGGDDSQGSGLLDVDESRGNGFGAV